MSVYYSMLTFLAAMMAVFFDNTSSVTRIVISSVLLILLVMVSLLLYLERDNTVSSSDSAYMHIFMRWRTKVTSWREHLLQRFPRRKSHGNVGCLGAGCSHAGCTHALEP